MSRKGSGGVPGLVRAFSTVDIQDLGTSLPLRGGLSGPKCLTARTPSKDGLAPAFLPCLLGSWPRLTGVLFPCAVPCTARARAQLLPNGKGDRRAAGQWTECMALAPAQGDRGLEPVSGQELANPDPYMPALLMLAPAHAELIGPASGPGPKTKPLAHPLRTSLRGSQSGLTRILRSS